MMDSLRSYSARTEDGGDEEIVVSTRELGGIMRGYLLLLDMKRL